MDNIVIVENEDKIQDKIKQSFLENLKHQGEKFELLLGLSGGLDSSVLLFLLAKMQVKLSFNLKAIHIHHGLNSSADDWLAFCRKKCESLNIGFYDEKIKINCDSELGLEGEARILRYKAIV